MGVGSQTAAVERGQDAGFAAALRVEQGGVGLMPVEMQGTAAIELEHGKRRQVVVVAAAHDGALAVLWHDERQRRFIDLAGVQMHVVFRRHVMKHVAEPVVGVGGDQVGLDA